MEQEIKNNLNLEGRIFSFASGAFFTLATVYLIGDITEKSYDIFNIGIPTIGFLASFGSLYLAKKE